VKQNLQEGDDFARPAQLDWMIIEVEVDKPFIASELEFLPLPVRVTIMKFCIDIFMYAPLKWLARFYLLRSCMERTTFV
jgi:hypothetical protein